MIRGLCFSIIILAASPSWGDVPEHLQSAFLGWADANGVTSAVMVASFEGVPKAEVSLNRTVDEPVELASLSKAITAVCAATLMQAGVWTKDTTSAQVLGQGPEGLSLAQLLTHQAGLGPDQTQILMPLWLGGRENKAPLAANAALGREKQTGTPQTFSYNNENYAILGEMIAAQTGHRYESYCFDKVLKPAGVTTAAASASTGAFLPYGGWQMSAQDYARFHWHAFGPGGIIGARVKDWPQAKIDGHVGYGMGMVQRPFRDSYNFWHFGALCFPGRLTAGSYVVMWMEGWSVFAAYDICTSDSQMFGLDQVLTGAVFQ